MDNIEARLIRSFAVIFPELEEAHIREASMDNVASWDSVATVTLINVVEEEFGIRIPLEEVEHISSFPQFLSYLQSRI